MLYLKQSTSQAISLGVFVNSTDGVTPETGLTIANTDIKISKNGAAFVSKTLGGATADGANGWYITTLDATDTDTVGNLVIEVTVAGALNVFQEYQVLTAEAYESMFGASAVTLATSEQLGNLAVGSAAISAPASGGVTVLGGVEETGDYTDTETKNAVYHTIPEDVNGDLDVQYTFDVGANGTATEVVMFGYFNGNGDTLAVQAWNYVSSQWDDVGSMTAVSGTTPGEVKFNLNVSHTGTAGADKGKSKVRGYSISLSSVLLAMDQVYISYAIVSQSVGYDNGSVWIDTADGSTGTEPFINGVADNPVSTLAEAIVIGNGVGLSKYTLSPESEITFAEAHAGEIWEGLGWTLHMGGQDLSQAHISHCKLDGACTISTGEVHVDSAYLETCSFGGNTHLSDCKFDNNVTITAAGDYMIEDCKSGVAGGGTPVITKAPAIGAPIYLNIRNWSGGISLAGLEAGDKVSLEGTGGNVTVNGTGGEVHIRGIFESVIDSSGGLVTIDRDADIVNRFDGGATVDVVSINGSTDAAVNLSSSALAIVPSLVNTGVDTTTFSLQSGSSTNDTYVGRQCIFTSGSNENVAKTISSYVGATKTVVVEGVLNSIPLNGDKVVIV